jgi:hypothetical protein
MEEVVSSNLTRSTNYEALSYAPGNYVGCRTVADRILRTRRQSALLWLRAFGAKAGTGARSQEK